MVNFRCEPSRLKLCSLPPPYIDSFLVPKPSNKRMGEDSLHIPERGRRWAGCLPWAGVGAGVETVGEVEVPLIVIPIWRQLATCCTHFYLSLYQNFLYWSSIVVHGLRGGCLPFHEPHRRWSWGRCGDISGRDLDQADFAYTFLSTNCSIIGRRLFAMRLNSGLVEIASHKLIGSYGHALNLLLWRNLGWILDYYQIKSASWVC